MIERQSPVSRAEIDVPAARRGVLRPRHQSAVLRSVAWSMPPNRYSNVDFPEPLGPMIVINCRSVKVKLTSSTALISPPLWVKYLLNPLATIVTSLPSSATDCSGVSVASNASSSCSSIGVQVCIHVYPFAFLWLTHALRNTSAGLIRATYQAGMTLVNTASPIPRPTMMSRACAFNVAEDR